MRQPGRHFPTLAILAVLAVLPVLLSACAASAVAPARVVGDGDTFTLGVGEQVAVSTGGRLRYLSVVGDSRCPPDVQCVWAGVAEISMRWTPGAGVAQDFRLKTDAEGDSHAVGSHRLTLVSLDRGGAPRARFTLARR